MGAVFAYLIATAAPWILDPDGYQRLNRVVQLLEGGNWYDNVYHRANPPQGEPSHWTRPLDALLALFALPLLPFLEAKRALLVSSPVAILFQAWLATAAFAWTIRPYVSKETFGFAPLLFAMQPVILIRGFLPQQPDHHGLSILLFAVLLGIGARIAAGTASDRAAFLGGLATGLSLWVSTEAFVPLLILTGLLGLAWIRSGSKDLARSMTLLWGGTAIALAIGLPLERPPGDWTAIEFDRLSPPHVAMGLAGFLGWGGLARFPAKGRGARLIQGVALAALLGSVLHFAFPGILKGPLANVDPAFAAAYSSLVAENQPIVSRRGIDPVLAAMALSLPSAALVFLTIRRTADRWLLLGTLVPFTILAASMVRLAPYSQVVALAILLVCLDRWFASRWRVAIVLLLAMGPSLATMGIAKLAPEQPPKVAGCALDPVLPVLNGTLGDRPRTILSGIDAPRMLFETPHRQVVLGMHREADRLVRLWRALAAPDDGPLLAMVKDHGIDLVLDCPAWGPNPFADPSRAPLLDHPPSWLEPIPIPGQRNPKGYRLFAVRLPNGNGAAPSPATAGR
jgi:hypothetical protein